MAREAGVSIATVSNVLNRPGIVAVATRARVQGVIDALGFVRTEGARQLRGLPAPVVAVMVPQLATSFGIELARGVEEEAARLGLGAMIHSRADAAAEPGRYVSFLAAQGVRGVVLAAGDLCDRTAQALREHELPLVVVDAPSPCGIDCSVSVDDTDGALAAMRHIREQGHRSVAYVDGPASPHLQGRLDAVTGAWRVHGKATPEILTVRSRSLSAEAGREAVQALLDGSCRPTAIVCADVVLTLPTASKHLTPLRT
ncbi:LacI family DNA-binding transcriptional regulator [Streptomyces scopuliridis]|uniref:LacI family DNA-binding transcriptional regulator n=1 Tax=Streptomyces scopuliridis TaxID=452529 RepID=UPI00368BE846